MAEQMALQQEMQHPASAASAAGGGHGSPSQPQSMAPSGIHQHLHRAFPINLTDIFPTGNLSLFSSDKSNPENVLPNFCSFPKISFPLKKQTST